MANKVRGEVEVTLKGKKYVLRPTFEAIAEAESRIGLGMTGIALKFARQEHGMREVAAMIYAGLLGAGNTAFSYEEVGGLVQKAGFSKFVQPACDFAREAMRGDVEEEEEKK